MGFDNECIVNIQSLAGEYFCPVCRTLVYPNEAFQSQCTHLYCKPCLAYVVSFTQACPYDGYLVTETGSKPLTETNKALAETIGKIPVHCLYHRSGCTWQGSLSDCTSHCSGCTFGNSPVVCNRCGVQIVHRQVQEHAQTCNVNGAIAQTQPATTNVQDSATSGAAVASDQNKSGAQPGVQNAQPSATQPVAAVPPPGQNPNQMPQAVGPNAVPTPEQWYQYQQYYQQYPGYDPYQQQAFQQYYPYQPQAAAQIQQHPPPSLVQGQPHPHPQPHPQLQPTQPLAQAQAQAQVQPQPHPYPQAPATIQNQNQAQPNQPHSSHPPPPPPPHGLLPPQPYPQPQPHPQQQMQGPQIQYQQVHHPHTPLQPQAHLQPHAQGHPQAQYPPHSQPHPLPPPPQANQPPTLNAPPPNQHSSIQSVTGHHSYQQPHGQQQMQQYPPPQQYPQPPAHMRPPQPHAFPPNQQQPVLLPSQGQPSSIPPAQQQMYPNNQQTGPAVHQRPVMQPQQHMPQQYVQQQAPPFTGQVSAQVHNPLHNTGHFAQQQPQLRPQGPPQAMQQYPPPHIQPQQSVAVHGMQPQSHVARPSLPNQAGQLQQFPQNTGALGAPPQLIPPQHSSNQLSANPSYANSMHNQLQASSEQKLDQSGFLANTKADERKVDHTSERNVEHKDAGSPSQKSLEKNVAEGKSDPGMQAAGDEHKPRSEGGDSYKHEKRPNEEGAESTLEPSTDGGKAGNSQSTDASVKQAEKNVVNASLQNSAEGNKTGGSQAVNGRDHLHHGPVGDESGGFQGKGFEQTSNPSQFSDQGRRQLPPMSYEPSPHQRRPSVPSMSQAGPPTGPPFDGRLPGHPPVGSLGPGHRPQPGQVFTPPAHLQPPGLNQPGSFHPDNPLGEVPDYGRGPSQFGSTHRSFEPQHGTPPGQYNLGPVPLSHAGISRMSQGEPVGPPMGAAPSGSFESHGQLMGRAPPHRGPEGHSGPPRPITPMEGDMLSNHRTIGQPFGSESNPPMGMNGAFGGMRDERFKAIEKRSNPFSMGQNRRLDQPEFQGSVNQHPRSMDRGPPRNHDKASHGYDAGQNVEPGPPGAPVGFLPPYRPGASRPNDSGERGWAVGNYDDNRGRSDSQNNPDSRGPVPVLNRHHMEGFPPRSPGRDYHGNHSRPFGGFSDGIDDIGGRERPGSFNLPPPDENRFSIRPPGQMRRREFEGPGNPQMGEHLRRGELFNTGNVSGHPPLGEPGFDPFGHGRMNESAGPGGYPHRAFGEPFGMSSHPRVGEPGFRSSYTRQEFPNDRGPFAGDSDSFDRFRKRNQVSTGWCRICRVDCETVEGLDMHSQTREHQKMTMDMVISIKEKNGKKQKTSKDHSGLDEVNKSRKVGFSARGKKP